MNEQLLVIMRGVQKGEKDSFERLYLLTRERVKFFLLSKGIVGEDVAELMSDCYVVIFEKSGKFRGESQVMTWILGVVNVKCREFFRKRRVCDSALLELPDSTDFALSAVLSADLKSAVKTLSREEYNIFVYKLCFCLTYEEIGRILNLPVGTLKRSVYEIREKLRYRLKEAR